MTFRADYMSQNIVISPFLVLCSSQIANSTESSSRIPISSLIYSYMFSFLWGDARHAPFQVYWKLFPLMCQASGASIGSFYYRYNLLQTTLTFTFGVS